MTEDQICLLPLEAGANLISLREDHPTLWCQGKQTNNNIFTRETITLANLVWEKFGQNFYIDHESQLGYTLLSWTAQEAL